MDTSNPPFGEYARREILDYIAAVGDDAEADYLEVKGDIDLTKTAGVTKVAKFLLGVANRIPRDARRNFGGYAVLVLGATSGDAVDNGLPTEQLVEPHELEEKLRPYLGDGFPRWHMERVHLEENGGRQILFIIAPPPEDGQSPFPCRKSFDAPDKQGRQKSVLSDGAIYFRSRSSTRAAVASEIDALNARARAAGPSAVESATVRIVGTAHRPPPRLVEWVTHLHDRIDEMFVDEHLKPRGDPSSPFGSLFTPQPIGTWRTSPKEALRRWREDRPNTITSGCAHVLAHTVDPIEISIDTERWVPEPELKLTFRNCELIDIDEQGEAGLSEVAPQVPLDTLSASLLGVRPSYAAAAPNAVRPSVTWQSVDMDVVVSARHPGLRPGTPWAVADEFVLIARDAAARTVTVDWVMTQAGADTPLVGSVQLAVTSHDDLQALWDAFRAECLAEERD